MNIVFNDLEFGKIKVGDVFSFKKLMNSELVDGFAKLTGDYNSLHMDVDYAKKNGFDDRVVHGLLAGSLFSTLVGMLCPGRQSLYLSQNLNFKRPIILGTEVIIKGEVVCRFESTQIIKLKTLVCDEKDKIMIEGEALVKVRPKI